MSASNQTAICSDPKCCEYNKPVARTCACTGIRPGVTLRATMWAEMKPDCYGGKDCDEIEPQWHCYADGDKESDDIRKPLEFDPRIFPPGTKVTVEEPTCQNCQEFRHLKSSDPPAFEDKCECGFDWVQWTLNEYA